MIVDSFLATGDPISKRNLTDVILKGIHEEENMFVMVIYHGKWHNTHECGHMEGLIPLL